MLNRSSIRNFKLDHYPLLLAVVAFFVAYFVAIFVLIKRLVVLVAKGLWLLVRTLYAVAKHQTAVHQAHVRDRAAFAAKAAAPWPPTEAIDAKVAFMDGETVTSIAARLNRDRAAVGLHAAGRSWRRRCDPGGHRGRGSGRQTAGHHQAQHG